MAHSRAPWHRVQPADTVLPASYARTVLFSPASHPGLADGSITRTFRTWARAQARAGARHRVGGMLLEIDDVRRVAVADLTDEDARAAGEHDLATLLARLGSPTPSAQVWRVDLHYAGPDDRIALRADDALTAADIAGLRARLDRLDAAAAAPWTRDTLRLIATRPAVVSTELAATLGRERAAFKIDVRKLKNLGLTESLDVGYRLSARGFALLRALDEDPGPLPVAGLLNALQSPVKGAQQRYLLGLTGPPGAGKSVLAGRLATGWTALGRSAAAVGLDGFHLSAGALAERGLADVKGAPETFDAAGFVDLLGRLRAADGDVSVPGFDRAREQTVPAATTVARDVQLVLVEGNYLLLGGAWRPVRDLLDAVWYVDVPPELRLLRLVARHVTYGRTPEQASAWVHRSDEANARRIGRTRHRADAFVDVASGSLRFR